MKDEFDYRFEILKLEIETVQAGIKSYDSILFTIKGWAITIFSAFIVIALQVERPLYLVFCAASIILFWLIDTLFKVIQWIYRGRYLQLEKYLQSSDFLDAIHRRCLDNFTTPDIDRRFHVQRGLWRLAIHAAITPNTSMLYLLMIAFLAILGWGMTAE